MKSKYIKQLSKELINLPDKTRVKLGIICTICLKGLILYEKRGINIKLSSSSSAMTEISSILQARLALA